MLQNVIIKKNDDYNLEWQYPYCKHVNEISEQNVDEIAITLKRFLIIHMR